MKLRYIAFKWHVEASFEDISRVIEQNGYRLSKKHTWTRSIGDHTLQIDFRSTMSTKECSYFWIRFSHKSAATDKGVLERVLSEWYFTISRHFITYINWLQVAVDVPDFKTLFGFKHSSSNIWVKNDGSIRFSFFPYQDHYFFEVKNEDIRKTIQHQRFSQWIDELKHNLQGEEKPNDQIRFDLVV